MITKQQKVAVATFVIVCLLLAAGTVATLWGLNATKKQKRYTITTSSSVSGLSKSAAVNYLGVNVGKVEKMEFLPAEVKLTIAVAEETPINAGTKAQLTAQGITGIQYIELVPPPPVSVPPTDEEKKQHATLDDGGALELEPSLFQEAATFFSQNKGRVGATIASADVFLKTATAAVVSGEGSLERVSTKLEALLDEDRAQIKELLDRTSTIAKDVEALLARLKERQVAEQLSDTLASAKDTLDTTKKTIANLDHALTAPPTAGQSALGDTIADLRSTARSAAMAADAARDLLARVGPRAEENLDSIKATLEQVQRTVRTLDELSREVKGRPALLVRDLSQPRRDIPDK